MSQQCPICHTLVADNPRYPKYLCRNCAARAADIDGRPLVLRDVGPQGLYSASYAETRAPYDSNEVYVDGVPCWAREAHFGGIVIQTR